MKACAPSASCSRMPTICSTRSPNLWPSVSLTDLKLSRSTNSSAKRVGRCAAAASAADKPGGQMPAVGQFGQRIMMREVMQRAGAILDMLLEHRLMGAQAAFGGADLGRHGIEGIGELGDFGRSRRCGRVTARSPAARRRVATVSRRTGTEMRSASTSDTSTHHHLDGNAGRDQGMLRVVRRLRGTLRRGRQRIARRRLQQRLRIADQLRAVAQELMAIALIAGIEAVDFVAQAHRILEVLANDLHPGHAR